MHHRLIAILVAVCLALGTGGCASNANRSYEEVLMPLQTGSVLHRRVLVKTGGERKSQKKKEEKKKKAPNPDAEPSATPAPEEESTPPADRFR